MFFFPRFVTADLRVAKRVRFLCIVALFVFLPFGCTTHNWQSPYADKGIQLAGWEAECLSEREYSQWYLFWGAYPINKIDDKVLFPKQDRAYKILFKTTWWDGFVSFLGGSTISLTKKTWVISDCNKEQ